MRRLLRVALGMLAAAAVLALPLSAGITLLLLPLWSWLEATTGFESVGRSGPADWCFELVYGLLLGGGLAVLLWRSARRRGRTRYGG
jgi:hypothetical protein